jgi:hypothetical protein
MHDCSKQLHQCGLLWGKKVFATRDTTWQVLRMPAAREVRQLLARNMNPNPSTCRYACIW